MLLIGYGIVALLLIVVLIVVNVRASKRGASREEPAAEAKAPEEEARAESSAAPAPPIQEEAAAPPTVEAESHEDDGRPAAIDAKPETRLDRPDGYPGEGSLPPRGSRRQERPERTEPAPVPREETKDASYRQALRKLRTGSNPATPRASKSDDKIISDSDYRRAMQNFRKPGDKKD